MAPVAGGPPDRSAGALSGVLVLGVPRSGTTWVARMLAGAEGAGLVVEPDNHLNVPFALHAKLGLPGGFYPRLSPGEDAPAYRRLWREAFAAAEEQRVVRRLRRAAARRLLAGGPRADIRRAFVDPGSTPLRLRLAGALAVPERAPAGATPAIVKSVHAPLAAAWVAAEVDAGVAVVLRDVLNVVSSWAALGWIEPDGPDELAVSGPAGLAALASSQGAPPPPRSGSHLARTTWLLASLTLVLQRTAAANPSWVVVRHEEITREPVAGFRALAAGLGIRWTPSAEEAVRATARPGGGFETTREPAQVANAWRRLAPAQLQEAVTVLAAFADAVPGSPVFAVPATGRG